MTQTDISHITADGEPYMVFSGKTSTVVGQKLSAAEAAKLLSEGPREDQLVALSLLEWGTLAAASQAG